MEFCCEIFLHTLEQEKRELQSIKVNHLTCWAHTRAKSSFIGGEIPPINTVSSLTTPGRSNIFITSSARRKVTVIHFIRFLGLLFQHFFHHQILTKVINTYWIRSRNISFLWSSRFPFSLRPEQKMSKNFFLFFYDDDKYKNVFIFIRNATWPRSGLELLTKLDVKIIRLQIWGKFQDPLSVLVIWSIFKKKEKELECFPGRVYF